MGDLATTHGFYSTASTAEGSTAVEEGGEALTIADTSEVWVFHILPDDTGRSAIWAAQRVPDDEATVVANMFVIRVIDTANTTHAAHNFMYSSNMFDIAKKYEWWDGESPFDFTAVYSAGESGHPYYNGRRVWRVLSLFAPSLNLDPELGAIAATPTYPFSVKPDHPVTLHDVFAIYRDHYEGTEFDLTTDLAGGPWHTPNRFDAGPNEKQVQYGSWERSIGLHRTMLSYVAQVRPNKTAGGILHFGPSIQHATVYIPIFTSVLTDSPQALSQSNQRNVSTASVWWAVQSLTSLLDSKYSVMIPDVRQMQQHLETVDFPNFIANVDALDSPLTDQRDNISANNQQIVDLALQKVWSTFWTLIAKYQNGYDNYGETEMGYPAEWLETAGYTSFRATQEQFDFHKNLLQEENERANALVLSHQAIPIPDHLHVSALVGTRANLRGSALVGARAEPVQAEVQAKPQAWEQAAAQAQAQAEEAEAYADAQTHAQAQATEDALQGTKDSASALQVRSSTNLLQSLGDFLHLSAAPPPESSRMKRIHSTQAALRLGLARRI
eukprot:gnl/TRDRNA2_/TRDRNA2_38292_c0_seq1.p1 gnl/TRDRNA2_/TRDRNA2_38292_c0~~gnl/TRDRNA2_/TRDRNA2_38292_c0_seq1.p1  ORF type:complete len:578 (+),score=77.89 gnl/TRDRNA2_/TRDRNA2_38292_c0_seq1:71-1735(+)